MIKKLSLGLVVLLVAALSLVSMGCTSQPVPEIRTVEFEMVRDISHWPSTLSPLEVSKIDRAALDSFPSYRKAELTSREQLHLGLHLVSIPESQWFYNWDAKTARFRKEQLVAGTMMLADRNEIIRYKDDCKNRVVLIRMERPVPVSHAVPARASSAGGIDWAKTLEGLGNMLTFVAAICLILLMIALTIAVLVWFLRRASGGGANPHPPTPAPAPLVPVAPIAPPAASPSAPIAPAQVHRGGRHVITRGQRAGEETHVTMRGFTVVHVAGPNGTVADIQSGGGDIVITG